jgi:four helix bundle protein
MIKDVEDLEVYKRSMNLLPSTYKLANSLPKGEFKRKRQLTDAAGSISALMAEGFAKRRSEKEFKRFLGMALGSSDEVITHIRQIKIIGFPKASIQDCDTLIDEFRIVSKQINTLIKIWRNFGSDSSDLSDSLKQSERKMMI